MSDYRGSGVGNGELSPTIDVQPFILTFILENNFATYDVFNTTMSLVYEEKLDLLGYSHQQSSSFHFHSS